MVTDYDKLKLWVTVPLYMAPSLPGSISKLRMKLPQILVIAIVAVILAFVLLDTLEDTVIEGEPFAGTPLAAFFNAIITFTHNITGTVQSLGYVGLFVLMVLESSSLPVPSEVILPFTGYLISRGLLNFWAAVLVSTGAGLAGSLVDYYIGLKGMSALSKRASLRNLLYNKGRLTIAENWFKRYGPTTVFLSRLLPGFRTLISFPSGAVKMPLSKFVVYTTAGCLLWDIVLIYAGVVVGTRWRVIAGVASYLIITAVVVLVVALLLFIFSRKRRRKIMPPESQQTHPQKFWAQTTNKH